MLYINSPGGHVTAGLAIYDTMQYVRCDVATICMGQAASMGAFLLAAGHQGQALRAAALAHHDPPAARRASRARRPTSRSTRKEILKMRDTLNELLREAHRPAGRQDQEGHRPRLLHVVAARPRSTASSTRS